tara:strand:+ start:684 stop:854 length:171 start_codon:yes stop_codon:yes gene_type:complete
MEIIEQELAEKTIERIPDEPEPEPEPEPDPPKKQKRKDLRLRRLRSRKPDKPAWRK